MESEVMFWKFQTNRTWFSNIMLFIGEHKYHPLLFKKQVIGQEGF